MPMLATASAFVQSGSGGADALSERPYLGGCALDSDDLVLGEDEHGSAVLSGTDPFVVGREHLNAGLSSVEPLDMHAHKDTSSLVSLVTWWLGVWFVVRLMMGSSHSGVAGR